MKRHILVIDDEAPIRELLQAYFEKYDFLVSTVGSGAEAVQVAGEIRFDLAILDIVLPDADGMEVLRNLRTKHPEMPVIMMSGIGLDEDLAKEARQNGASGYVSKTTPLDQLLGEVRRLIPSQ